jgi:chemotaxis protein methyltransferase CheR
VKRQHALAEAASPSAPAATVLTTDIDTRAIETGACGIYALADVEKLEAARLRRFFLRGTGKRQGRVRVSPNLRSMVEFRALNLLAPDLAVRGSFDAIFCRNLLIYFDKPTQARLLDRLARQLRPDGLLFAGHSENLTGISRAFELRGHTVYTRVLEQAQSCVAVPA